jgi:hypothetical protein
MARRTSKGWERWYDRDDEKPPIIFSPTQCDICKKPRGYHYDHRECSKIRKRQAMKKGEKEEKNVKAA